MAVTAFALQIKRLDGAQLTGPMAATATAYRNAIVMRDGSGDIKNGATAASCWGVGVAGFNDQAGANPDVWDNSAGAAGDITLQYHEGIYGPFANSGTSITAGMEGDVCYIVDNVTVHATSNSGARSPAGIIHKITSGGVYVLFDEMRVRVALSIGNPSGISFTQTYSTANATIAAPTAAAPAALTTSAANAATAATLTDNGGGAAADGTIAIITNAANAGSADVAPVADAIKELSDQINKLVADVADIRTKFNQSVTDLGVVRTPVVALVADDLDNRQAINSVIDALQAAGLAG